MVINNKMNDDNKKNEDEVTFLTRICDNAFNTVVSEFNSYTDNIYKLSEDEEDAIEKIFSLHKKKYLDSLRQSLKLSQQANSETRYSKKRVVYFNPIMEKYKESILKHFPPAANIWILDGIIVEKQIGGLKKLVGLSDEEGSVIDILNSASSLCLGAENPWLVKADYLENILGIKDNFATIYHPGLRHAFVLSKLASLYPGKQRPEDIAVHIESSGAIANSIAIESVIAYMEKQGVLNGQILAVDGTWAGGYGSAREATGFGVNKQAQSRAPKNIWVDRCLPPPTRENSKAFFEIIEKKLSTNEVSGLFIEPDMISDLGLVNVEEAVIKKVIDIFKGKGLPIILDCVQQIGRTGSYWGEYADNLFRDIPLLVVTTAKSASNGQPLSFTLMPKIIADAAYPLTQLTTNQMNGPLLRTLVVAEIFKNYEFQAWIKQKSKDIELIAEKYNLPVGEKGLKGKFLNRGVYMGDNEQVKLAQIALLIEDGILAGAFPQTIRYQPMLLELSETNKLIAEVVCKRIQKIRNGEVAKEVLDIHGRMKNISSGLARKE